MNKKYINLRIDAVHIKENLTKHIFLDLELIDVGITINNIEISVHYSCNDKDKENIQWMTVKYPYSWNPMISENFSALTIQSEEQGYYDDFIRNWVRSQPILMDFLHKGWNDTEAMSQV